jgi:hypothetical protein
VNCSDGRPKFEEASLTGGHERETALKPIALPHGSTFFDERPTLDTMMTTGLKKMSFDLDSRVERLYKQFTIGPRLY